MYGTVSVNLWTADGLVELHVKGMASSWRALGRFNPPLEQWCPHAPGVK